MSGLAGEMSSTGTDKKGLQKILTQIRSGSAPALLMGVLASRRPWTQFVQTENFKAPASLPRLTRRFYKNVEYFQANYLFVFLGLFAYCLITSPFLLLIIVASFFGYRKLTSGPNTWKIGGWEITRTQQYSVVAACSMVICWFAGVGAILFWVLGATVTFVALHAGLYDAESIPQVQEEQFGLVEQVWPSHQTTNDPGHSDTVIAMYWACVVLEKIFNYIVFYISLIKKV